MHSADLALAALLVIVLPGYMLARSLARRGAGAGGDRVRRYQRTIGLVAAPLLALTALWLTLHRPVAALGLGPPDRLGVALVMIAALAIGALAVGAPRAGRTHNPSRKVEAAALMPVGGRETAWFLAFAIVVGAGWEVLYRGYLWWALAPVIGTVGAVLVMALSYGAAHGYRSPGALLATIVSALLFAGGYALSGSLWWLIVIHVGLPLVGLRLRPAAAT